MNLRVTVGKDEAVPVHPLGVLGVELHEAGEQDVGSRSHALERVSARFFDPDFERSG